MTKPSRFLSKGRLASAGASFRVDTARMAMNPPSPSGVSAASAPPAITASWSPSRIARNASPMACVPDEQALVGV